MKLLTKDTDYAIRALLVLAKEPGQYLSARVIAKKQKMPYQFLRTIMQKLIKNKLVESKEGISGGFKIKKDPKKIKIRDIIHVFQGNIALTECLFRKKICHNRKSCALRREIKKIELLVANEFNKLTIYKLLEKTSLGKKGGR
jgi:Rrf2 family transcriptional regulator, cysteine metabolism repressor